MPGTPGPIANCACCKVCPQLTVGNVSMPRVLHVELQLTCPGGIGGGPFHTFLPDAVWQANGTSNQWFWAATNPADRVPIVGSSAADAIAGIDVVDSVTLVCGPRNPTLPDMGANIRNSNGVLMGMTGGDSSLDSFSPYSAAFPSFFYSTEIGTAGGFNFFNFPCDAVFHLIFTYP